MISPKLQQRLPLTCRIYLYCLGVGAALSLLSCIINGTPAPFLSGTIIVTLFFVFPLVLTCVNALSLKQGLVDRKCVRVNWVLTVVAGIIDSVFYAELCEIVEAASWDVQLYNNQLHQPVWGEAWPTVATLIAVGACGFVVLACVKLDRLSPIVIVTCIAAMYVTAAELLTFAVQVFNNAPLLALPPINCIVMAAALIREKVGEWNDSPEHHVDRYDKNGLLNRLNKRLADSANWPLWALPFSLPLLGVILAMLTLFGQRPDYLVRAWTETADWALSTKVAPVNLTYDEHYLCTVAASGHERLVRPIRYGERHGHRIVVNRQLLVANAFEDVLEEKTPHLHRVVRGFYDWCGLPVASYIRRSRIACDVTYLVMKPLEWVFLFVLYLVDANPENRIAVQYLPRREC